MKKTSEGTHGREVAGSGNGLVVSKRPIDQARTAVQPHAMFRPVQPGSAFEESVEQILQAVKFGAVRPGDRLPAERELAGRLNVSRVTLREAIRSLQQAGYLETRRGRTGGTFVLDVRGRSGAKEYWPTKTADAARIEDAITFRIVVETGSAEMAARGSLISSQRELLMMELRQVMAAPLSEYRLADTRFHLLIAQLTGSAQLAKAVADARMQVNDLLNALPVLSHPIVHANEQHSDIVDAILTGDGVAARHAMERHLEATAALLRGFLT